MVKKALTHSALMALFGFALTLFEYASVYPGLIEFRDAPPFNRIRFMSLFLTVLLLSLAVQSQYHASTLTRLIEVLGTTVASSIDVPYSPVRLLQLALPADASLHQVALVRTAARSNASAMARRDSQLRKRIPRGARWRFSHVRRCRGRSAPSG